MTKAILKGLLGAWCVLFLAALPLRAAEARHPQPYVVLIGVSQYADKDIVTRPHAEDDVKALYDLFTQKGVLGADKEHIRLLLGSPDAGRNSEPATRENILKSLRWIQENARQDDEVIVAFIGQGGTLNDKGDRLCYFASDSTVKDRQKNAVAAADIAQILDKMKSQRFSVFLDLTYKGFMLGKEAAPEPNYGEGLVFPEWLGSEGKEEKASAPGRVLFMASLGRAVSPDLEKHGLFTEALLKGLKGAADKEGYEPDGSITVDELTEYLHKEITDLSREKIKEIDQRPFFQVFGGRGTHFVLVRNPAVMPKVTEREQKFEKIAKENNLSPELTEEGKQLLERMPKLKARQDLRKAYQEVADGTLTLDKLKDRRTAILNDLKLKRTLALQFAQQVIKATQILEANYVKELNQGELVGGAVKGLYRRLDEKMPNEINEQVNKVKELSPAAMVELLADAREHLGKREDLADGKDLTIALKGMMNNLDPYTTYFDPETVRKMNQDIQGNFTGIGIQITKDANRDMLKVTTPLRGSPAHKAGVMAGDIITQVTELTDKKGNPLPKPVTTSTKGMLLDDAVKKILGPPGTDVKITVEREGVDKPLDFTITRARIETESVYGVKRRDDNSWDYVIDPTNKIAYVRLYQFQSNTARDLERVMKELHNDKTKIKGLVLDLRFNPGGLLSSAVRISDLFIDDGLIVSVRPRNSQEERYTGHHAGSYLDFPMVVLTNNGSASGSEIVAACLQDHRRAVVTGERSYGKGSVQNIAQFGEGEIKMTIATYWRPSGRNINKSSTSGKDDEEWGVQPDKGFELKLSGKEREDLYEHQLDTTIIPRPDRPAKPKPEFKDRQLEKALGYLRDQIKMAARGSSTAGSGN